VTPFAGYTWTNVTSYLDDTEPITRRFGRESSLSEVTPMELTFRLRNRDRRFEIENSASPYYPNVEGGRPCRVTMTQGGNLVPNGGFETDTAGWSAFAGATISRQSFGGVTFGTWNMRVITDGLTSAEGAGTSTIAVAPNTTYTFSAYVLEGSSANLRLIVNENNGGFIRANAGATFVGDGVTTRRSLTFTTTATTSNVQLYVLTIGTQAKTFYVEGAQLHTGTEPIAYVDTNGTADVATYNWAFGFIQDFPQDYPEGALVGSVPIVATCYLERIQQSDMGTRAFTQQLAGARINRVLHIAGQPTSMRTLDAGANTMMAQTDASGTVGDHAQKVARSDRGLFFFDGQGYAVFQDGTYRATNSRAISAQGTLGLPEIGYRRPNFHAPLSMVRNIIKLRRPGGVEVTAVDAVSKGKRGERDYSDELLLVDDSTLASRAADLLADYKDPVLRIRSVEFSPQQADGFWADSLGVRLSDRYMWTFAPMQGAPLLRDVHVEGVADAYDFREGAYSSVWFLSLAAPAPAPAAGSFRGLLALTG
jgi:hypothetical protein